MYRWEYNIKMFGKGIECEVEGHSGSRFCVKHVTPLSVAQKVQ